METKLCKNYYNDLKIVLHDEQMHKIGPWWKIGPGY